jgi:hypothetical protein
MASGKSKFFKHKGHQGKRRETLQSLFDLSIFIREFTRIFVSSQKEVETSQRFERLNHVFQGNLRDGVCHPQVIEKIQFSPIEFKFAPICED